MLILLLKNISILVTYGVVSDIYYPGDVHLLLKINIYKKDLHDPDNHDDVITHLEPDTLEGEVKWTLESITMNKASRGDRIPVELFKS